MMSDSQWIRYICILLTSTSEGRLKWVRDVVRVDPTEQIGWAEVYFCVDSEAKVCAAVLGRWRHFTNCRSSFGGELFVAGDESQLRLAIKAMLQSQPLDPCVKFTQAAERDDKVIERLHTCLTEVIVRTLKDPAPTIPEALDTLILK